GHPVPAVRRPRRRPHRAPRPRRPQPRHHRPGPAVPAAGHEGVDGAVPGAAHRRPDRRAPRRRRMDRPPRPRPRSDVRAVVVAGGDRRLPGPRRSPRLGGPPVGGLRRGRRHLHLPRPPPPAPARSIPPAAGVVRRVGGRGVQPGRRLRHGRVRRRRLRRRSLMVFTPIAFGRRRWDVPLNAALQDLQDQLDGKLDKAGGALTGGITTNLTERSAFFKTTSATQHAVTIYQASTTGQDVAAALNLISDNRETSAVYISGHETLPRGTVKITHTNGGTLAGDDTSASALSIDLRRGTAAGTACQGIFVTSTDGGTTGRLATFRNGGANLVTIPAAGSIYTATGAFGEHLPV